MILFACTTSEQKQVGESPVEESTPEYLVTVTAKDFTFDCPAQIKSGWTQFDFDNQGHAEHFFLLNKLPDSITYKRYLQEVTRAFDAVYDSIKAGMSGEDAIAMLGTAIPAWYFTGVK